MKKLIITIGSVMGLLTLLAIPVLAVDKASPEYREYLQKLQTAPVSSTPDQDQIETLQADMGQNYGISFCNGNLIGRYTQTKSAESAEAKTTASTELKLNDNQFGQAKTVVIADNNDVSISQTSGYTYGRDCDNRLSSGTALISGQKSAETVVHYGWRATSSGNIEQFYVLSD